MKERGVERKKSASLVGEIWHASLNLFKRHTMWETRAPSSVISRKGFNYYRIYRHANLTAGSNDELLVFIRVNSALLNMNRTLQFCALPQRVFLYVVVYDASVYIFFSFEIYDTSESPIVVSVPPDT